MVTVIQWVQKLAGQIEQQRRYGQPYEQRYRNQHILPFIANEYREVYGTRVDGILAGVLDAPRAGMGSIVVDALVERLTVLGGTSDDLATSLAMRGAWEDSDLDVMHREAHREAFIGGRSYGVVHRSVADPTKSVGTVESYEQAAVHRMQRPPYDVDAYLKIWIDEWTGDRAALLRLPDEDIDLIERSSPAADPEGSGIFSRWTVVARRGRAGPVPVVEFAHRSRLLSEPTSELDRLATLVDIIDLIEGLMVFAGHFGAVPIRYGTGLAVPRDPKDPSKPLLGSDGKPALGFNARADHFWVSTSPDAKFGQLEPAGLASFVTWAEHATSTIRRLTSIASTYFSLDVKSHMSAELLKTDEAPMVRRLNALGRDGSFNQSWRRFMGYMMSIEGHTGRVKPQWADPQTRMEAQAVDSFQKAVASGLGVATCAEQFLGWSPELAAKAVAESQEADAAVADQFSLLDSTTRAALKAVPLTGGTSADTNPPASA